MQDWVFCKTKYIICHINMHASTARSMHQQDSWEEPSWSMLQPLFICYYMQGTQRDTPQILLGQEGLSFKGLGIPYTGNLHMSLSEQTNLVEEKYYSYSCIPKSTTHSVPDNGSNSVLNYTCNYRRIENSCKHKWTQIWDFFPLKSSSLTTRTPNISPLTTMHKSRIGLESSNMEYWYRDWEVC